MSGPIGNVSAVGGSPIGGGWFVEQQPIWILETRLWGDYRVWIDTEFWTD